MQAKQAKRLPNALVAGLIVFATLGVFGPHLMMLGFRAVGAQPPGALYYFCLLNHHQPRPSQARTGGLHVP